MVAVTAAPLELVRAGGKMLPAKTEIPLGQRACFNCHHLFGGRFCRRYPIESAYVFVPGSDPNGQPTLVARSFMKEVPAQSYVCGEHAYEAEWTRRKAQENGNG